MKEKIRRSQNKEAVRSKTRLQRADIEHELRKSPDFQLSMLTAARHDRERMERLMAKLPAFRAWRQLSELIDAPAPAIPQGSREKCGCDSDPRRVSLRGDAQSIM